MKLTVTKSIILKELSEAAKYRGKEEHNGFVFLEASEDGLAFKATNGSVFYSNLLPLQVIGEEDLETAHEVHEAGAIALSPKFDEVLRKAPGKTVELFVEGGSFKINASGFKSAVPFGIVETPSLPAGEETLLIDTPFEFFDKVVKKTAFASATSESRPILKGINMRGNGEVFTAIATDSHRLSQLSIPSKISFEQVTIPAKPFADVLTSFNHDEKLKLYKFPSHVMIQQDDKQIFITLLDGLFPDTSRLTNVPESIEIKLNSKDLLTAIDRAMIFAKEDKAKKSSVIRFQQAGEKLRVFSFNNEGEIDSEIAIISQNTPLEVLFGISGSYFAEAIKAHDTDEITIKLEDNAQRPVYILSEEEGLIQLIVPIKIASGVA